MIDPAGLLAVAGDIARLDEARPRYAALRRAVSTAYYALFHLLIQTAIDEHIGSGPSKPVADVAARWFDHGKMRGVCDDFVKWADAVPPKKPADDAPEHEQKKWEATHKQWKQTQPKLFRTFETVYPKGPSPELRKVAHCFVALHTAREKADYDPTEKFTKASALSHVETAKIAFANMSSAGADPLRKFFLLLLLTPDIVRER